MTFGERVLKESLEWEYKRYMEFARDCISAARKYMQEGNKRTAAKCLNDAARATRNAVSPARSLHRLGWKVNA